MAVMFDLFPPEPYTFLKLNQKAEGNIVEQEYEAEGVFQLRDGMSQFSNVETPNSDATIWVKPDEAFVVELGNLVGHGIRINRGNDQNYRIVAQIEGRDQDLQYTDNLTLELKRELKRGNEWQDESLLPLE